MAATSRTPNYGLAIYEADNTVSMLNTFNNNMNVIDTTMKANEVTATTAESNITAINDSISKLNTELETVNTTVTDQGTTIDGLTANYTSLAGKVTAAEGNITTLQTSVQGLETSDTQQNAEIEEIQQKISGMAMPVPDWTKNIVKFGNGTGLIKEYTATKYCFLGGSLYPDTAQNITTTAQLTVLVNDVPVAITLAYIRETLAIIIMPTTIYTMVKPGDVIKITGTLPTAGSLGIYEIADPVE